MGRFKGRNLVGAIGPVTFRHTERGTIVSQRVKDVRQTVATKKSASFFGVVTSFAKILRFEMKAVSFQDTGLMNRLNKELMGILLRSYNKEMETHNFNDNHFNRLNGFDLNSNSPLKQYLWPLPDVTLTANQLTIASPELHVAKSLNFPDSATHCQMQIKVFQFDLNGGHHKKTPTFQFTVERTQSIIPEQHFSLDVAPGVLCVVGLGLRYYKVEQGMSVLLNSIALSPAALISAVVNEGSFSEKAIDRTVTVYEDGSSIGSTITHWQLAHPGFRIQ